MNWICKPFRDLCRGQRCYLEVNGIHLHGANETVVPCHSNMLRHGHGGSIKAHDVYTVPGCFACHGWLDHSGARREEKERVFMLAWERWMLDLMRLGLLVIADVPSPVAQPSRRRPVRAGAKLRNRQKQGKSSPTSTPDKCIPRRHP